jgi:demethylmenaquinone methyltransferase / 2-methoxy-6-polyprenyl-1,4-benzoquinol methylase
LGTGLTQEKVIGSNQVARELFDGLPPRYDRLAEVLSLGQNRRWRRAMVDAVVASGPRKVLDVATGPAGVALQVADRTDAWITGIDLTPEMLRAGVRNVRASPYSPRISLLIGRGEQLPFPDGCFDAVAFTYLLRYVDQPAAAVTELARVLKPGGVLANLEFHVPPSRVWYPLWVLYTRMVLPAAGLVTGGREWFEVGRFLGPSIRDHYRRWPLERHIEAWNAAGVADVQVQLMSLGGGLVMYGQKESGHG